MCDCTPQVTKSRHTFDRALRALPLTQHKRIWPLCVEFVRSYDLPETTVRVYRRYLKICPEEAEEYIDYLVSINRLDEAACRLVKVDNKKDNKQIRLIRTQLLDPSNDC